MTSSHPPVSKQEHDAAQQQKPASILPVSFIDIKWGVITVHDLDSTIIFKDLQGQQRNTKGMYALASWDWAHPKPENGIVNRHEHGLDPVDWKSFRSDCKVFVISRGVTNNINVRYEQLHRMRDALDDRIVLALDSAFAVDVINQLIINEFDEGLCFLLHSTC